jgi:4-amino-4-deoxy-L-arabinose transferase-like glycosyltransferase
MHRSAIEAEMPEPDSSNLSRAGPMALAVLALAVLTIAARVPLLLKNQAIEDEVVYCVVAHEILAGGQPYTSAVERKPPLLFWTYAAIFKVFGPFNWRALHGSGIAWVLLTMLALYLTARRLFDRWTGLIAALLYSVFQPWLYPNNLSFNGEVLMNLPIACAYLIGFARSRSRWRPELAVAGGLLAAAFLLKQPAAIAAIPLGVYVLLPGYRWTRGYLIVDSLVQATVLTAGFVAVLLAVGAMLLSRGLLGEAVYWTIGDHDIPHVFWGKALEHTATFAAACLPLLAGAAASLTNVELWTGRRAERTTLCGLLIVSAIGAAASGRFFPHYYIALLPPLTLLASPVVARLWAEPGSVSEKGALFGRAPGWTPGRGVVRWLSLTWVMAAAVLFFVIDWREFASLAPETQAGLYIRTHSDPDERLFVWGRQTQIYLDARRRPASRYITTFPLTGYIFGPPLPEIDTSARILPGAWDNLTRDFLAHSPRYIVDVEVGPSARYPVDQFPILAHLLARQYRPVLRTEESVVYQRVGGLTAAGCCWPDPSSASRPRP